MLKPLLLFLAAVLLTAACQPDEAPEPAGDAWDEVRQQGQGTLKALYVPAEGFAYVDEQGRLTGVTVELVREFARFVEQQHGVELDIEFIEETDWSRFYETVKQAGDGVIGMGNVTITAERRRELDFSPPYMTNIASLITHDQAPELERLEELGETLQGRDALAFEGTLHEERLRELTRAFYPQAELHMAGSNDEIIDRVSEQDRYFAYIDLYNYWRAVDSGAPLRRHEAADEAAEQFAYILPLRNSWVPVLEAFFEHDGGLTESDRYEQIMQQHLGRELAELLMQAGQHSGR